MVFNTGDEWYGEICTIYLESGIIVGEVINADKNNFIIKILTQKNIQEISSEEEVEVQIESLNSDDVFHYQCCIKSVRTFEKAKYLFLQLLSREIENRRKGQRLIMSSYADKPIKMKHRLFPPIGEKWYASTIIDIGAGGARLAGEEYYSKGQLIEAIITTPFLAECEVTLCRVVNIAIEKDSYFISLQFLNLSEHHKTLLYEFVRLANDQIKLS